MENEMSENNVTSNNTHEYDFPTWRNFRDFLNSLPPDDPRLSQRMEVLPNTEDSTKPTHLLPVVTWGTIEDLLHINGEPTTETRSNYDFQHHPELFVLVLDESSYDSEGNSYWTMQEDGSLVANKTGKVELEPLSSNKDFYTSKLRFTITVTHQFEPSRAVDIVKMALRFPAISEVVYCGGKTNFVPHGQPSDHFRPIKKVE
jgi:hypothetical protein